MNFLQKLLGGVLNQQATTPVASQTQSHPNFYFQGTGQAKPGQENWAFIGGRNPAPLLQVHTFQAPPLNRTPPTAPGWTYGPLSPNGPGGWRNPQGQPGILPHYITPGTLPPQPQWINPQKQQAFQNRQIQV